MVKRRRLVLLAGLLAVGSLAGRVRGTQGVDVTIGLGGRVVPGLPVPLRVLRDSLSDGAARLRVIQRIGSRGPTGAVISCEVPMVPSDAGDCEEVVLVYDVVLPLRVELLSAEGRVVAEREIELRSAKQDEPFPVGVGDFPLRLPGSFALLSPSELPTNWSAYSSAESVWIGGTRSGLDAGRWDSLARWVLSGGALVVFTGVDFFLLDAPRLRELLPITDPTVTTSGTGHPALTGILRQGATVLASRGGAPWIVSGRYGAGTVTLVSTDASGLDLGELDEIRRYVPPARSVSLTGITSDLLDLQPVERPDAFAALLLVGLCLIALSIVIVRAERRRPAAILVGVFGLLAAASYLYAAPRALSDAYQTNVKLLLGASVGASLTCSTSVSAARESVDIPAGVNGNPLEVPPPRTGHGPYSTSVVGGTATISLAPRERRAFVAQRNERVFARARVTREGELFVASSLAREVRHALLFLDGEVFALPAIGPGDAALRLGAPLPPRSYSLGAEGGAMDRLLEVAVHALWLEQGAWLVAGEMIETTSSEARTRTRDVVVYLVAVERG